MVVKNRKRKVGGLDFDLVVIERVSVYKEETRV